MSFSICWLISIFFAKGTSVIKRYRSELACRIAYNTHGKLHHPFCYVLYCVQKKMDQSLGCSYRACYPFSFENLKQTPRTSRRSAKKMQSSLFFQLLTTYNVTRYFKEAWDDSVRDIAKPRYKGTAVQGKGALWAWMGCGRVSAGVGTFGCFKVFWYICKKNVRKLLKFSFLISCRDCKNCFQNPSRTLDHEVSTLGHRLDESDILGP